MSWYAVCWGKGILISEKSNCTRGFRSRLLNLNCVLHDDYDNDGKYFKSNNDEFYLQVTHSFVSLY
jgi:hypothetical protein